MVPDRSIVWQATELDAGTLYMPLQHSDNQRTAPLLTQEPTGELLNSSDKRRIHLPPAETDSDLIIKEFLGSPKHTRRMGSLSDLSANIRLAAGLEAVDQRWRFWQIRGVEILGAFICHRDQSYRPELQARWIMRRVIPVAEAARFMNDEPYIIGRLPSLPDSRKRKALYEQAMAVTDTLPHPTQVKPYAAYDDRPANMLIEQLPCLRRLRPGVARKIDVSSLTRF